MNDEIIPMGENTWRIEDNGVRFFLLAGTERALLIDSGREVHNARDIAESLTDKPVSLLNTHADMDHTGSNAQFDSFYMHPAEEAHYRRGGGQGTLLPVEEGGEIDLGGRVLRILHLPGHTPGSIAVLDASRRVLISGDPIQEHGRIFMFGAHRNMEDYIRSLEQLEAFTGEFDEIWPSHGDIPIRPDVIPRLIGGAKDVLAGRIPGKAGEIYGHRIAVFDLGFTVLLCDPQRLPGKS